MIALQICISTGCGATYEEQPKLGPPDSEAFTSLLQLNASAAVCRLSHSHAGAVLDGRLVEAAVPQQEGQRQPCARDDGAEQPVAQPFVPHNKPAKAITPWLGHNFTIWHARCRAAVRPQLPWK